MYIFYCTLKEGEIPTEVTSCKGKVEAAKLNKMAVVGNVG